MDVENLPDPAAIDMDVSFTGKVTAIKEDGIRICSPSQLLATVNASLSSLQAPPQDWHLEFSIDGRPVPNDTKALSSRMLTSFHENPTTSNILRLLNILHELNANLDDVLDDSKETITLNTKPFAQFINTEPKAAEAVATSLTRRNAPKTTTNWIFALIIFSICPVNAITSIISSSLSDGPRPGMPSQG